MHMFDTLLDLNRQGQLNWCTKIQDILGKVNMSDFWVAQKVDNEKTFIWELQS